jgi:hypothetical protein
MQESLSPCIKAIKLLGLLVIDESHERDCRAAGKHEASVATKSVVVEF